MKGAVGQVLLSAHRPRADDKSGQQGEKRVKVQLQDRQKDIWAVGSVDIPAQSVVVTLYPYYWTKISGAGVEPPSWKSMHRDPRCSISWTPVIMRSVVWSRSCMVKRLLGKLNDYAFTNLSLGPR